MFHALRMFDKHDDRGDRDSQFRRLVKPCGELCDKCW